MMTKWQGSQPRNQEILLGFVLGAVSHTLVEKVLFRLIVPLPTQRSGLGDRPSVPSPPWSEPGHACHLLGFLRRNRLEM